jgi:hypothetical protein
VTDVEHVEAASKAITREESRGSVALWFGLLGSPLAWAGHLVANYSLEEWFACSGSSTTPGQILGLSVSTVSVLINSAMVAVALASGLVALRCWRRLRARQDGDERTDRARWMAFAGAVQGGLYLGIILLGYLPALTLGACQTTP